MVQHPSLRRLIEEKSAKGNGKAEPEHVEISFNFGLADAAEGREGLEQPYRKAGEMAGDHGDAHHHHHPTSDDFEHAASAAHRHHPSHEPAHEQSGQDEREAKTKGVDGEQRRSACHRGVRGGQGQNRSQHWSDARSPAERESETKEISGPGASAARIGMEPGFTIEPGHGYKAGREQAEDDDDPPAKQISFEKIHAQEPAQHGGAGPKDDEHGREAEHEAEAEAESSARCPEFCIGRNSVWANRAACDVGNIARHQRQNAGRQEGYDASGESRRYSDAGELHQPISPARRRSFCNRISRGSCMSSVPTKSPSASIM